MASASVTSPQSFTRYAYVGNNPLKFVDPSGLSMCSAEFSYEDCGGDAGFWGIDPLSDRRGGGNFGDEFAMHNREYGGMPANAAAALHQHQQRVNNAIGGYGFVTNAELRGIEIHTFIRDPETGQWVYAGGVPLIEDESSFDIFAGGRLDSWPPPHPRPSDGYDSKTGWRTQRPPIPDGFKPRIAIGPQGVDEIPDHDRTKIPSNASRNSKFNRGVLRIVEIIIKYGMVGGRVIIKLTPVITPALKNFQCTVDPSPCYSRSPTD